MVLCIEKPMTILKTVIWREMKTINVLILMGQMTEIHYYWPIEWPDIIVKWILLLCVKDIIGLLNDWPLTLWDPLKWLLLNGQWRTWPDRSIEDIDIIEASIDIVIIIEIESNDSIIIIVKRLLRQYYLLNHWQY